MNITLDTLCPNLHGFQILKALLCWACFGIVGACGNCLPCSIIPMIGESFQWQFNVSELTRRRLKVGLVAPCKEVLVERWIVLDAKGHSEACVAVPRVHVEHKLLAMADV